MTLTDLIQRLTDLRDELGGDAAEETPVQIAFQPSWPLRGEVANITTASEASEDGWTDPAEAARDKGVWLAINPVSSYDTNPYAPAWAWEATSY